MPPGSNRLRRARRRPARRSDPDDPPTETGLTPPGPALPPAPNPGGAYVPAVRTGNLLFVSGQLPMREGKLMAAGHVGREVSLQEAQACARQAARTALA